MTSTPFFKTHKYPIEINSIGYFFMSKNILLSGRLRLGRVIESVASLKAIFLAGAPGAGKDYILKRILLNYDLTELDNRQTLDLLNGPEHYNIVINRTSIDVPEIQKTKSALESAGYQTMMVFVNVTNEISKTRNDNRGLRGGRSVPDPVRYSKWLTAQTNIVELQQLFNHSFVSVDNSNDPELASFDTIERIVQRFMGNTFREHAGFEGTDELVKNYKKQVPGQEGPTRGR